MLKLQNIINSTIIIEKQGFNLTMFMCNWKMKKVKVLIGKKIHDNSIIFNVVSRMKECIFWRITQRKNMGDEIR